MNNCLPEIFYKCTTQEIAKPLDANHSALWEKPKRQDWKAVRIC